MDGIQENCEIAIIYENYFEATWTVNVEIRTNSLLTNLVDSS